MRNARFVLAATGAAGLLGAFLYGPTLGNAFAYDDIDYLNQAADVLTGRAGFWAVLFRPQGEHFVPVLRLLLTASASLFGTSATPLRLLVLLAHVLSAVFLALAARRLLRDDAAGLAAAVLYVLPCGFSSMWIWFPSGGCVPIGIAGITGALAAIVHAETLGRRRAALLAAAGCVFALACDNALVPLLSAPFFVSLSERRASGDRRLVSGLEVFLAALAAAALLATRFAYGRLTGLALHSEPVAAAKRFLFLACAAPFRYVFPGPTVLRPLGGVEWFPKMEAAFGILTALAAGAAFLLALVPEARRGARAALATLPAGLGFLALVAVARWNYPYEELFDADRYFFPLTIAAALAGAALLASLRARLAGDRARRRTLAALALCAFGFSVFLQRTALLNRVSWGVYAAHAERLAQLTMLAGLLSDAARSLPAGSPPLAVPDANLRVPGIHNGWISTRFLLAIANPRKTPRLVLADGPASGRDTAVLNDVLERWRIAIGEPEPWFAVEEGTLRDLRQRDAVDFLFAPRDADVSGFWGWERPRRWMGRRATVRILASTPELAVDASCPVALLAAARPPVPPPALEVSLADEAGGPLVPLGTVPAVERDRHVYKFKVPDAAFARLAGRTVRVVLAARPTWRPSDVTPGSDDTRELSVEVFRVSFAKE